MTTEERLSRLESELKALSDEFKKLISAQGPGAPRIATRATKQEIAACEKAWLETLKHFGIERVVLPHEQMKIVNLIETNTFKATLYALAGMRFEEATPTFKPSKNVSLVRAFDPKLFEKFINLASAKATEEKKKREATEQPVTHHPSQIQALISQSIKGVER